MCPLVEGGSCKFILKLTNSSHGESTPENINLSIFPVSGSWTEGTGLDMEGYLDVGIANWVTASKGQPWNVPGGDVIESEEINCFIESVRTPPKVKSLLPFFLV